MKYKHTTDNTKDYQIAADAVIAAVLNVYKPNSVLDLGCGLGYFLNAFEKNNVTDLTGIDGDYVQKEKLQTKGMNFVAADLEKKIQLSRRFDLAMSLEVAEHLCTGAAKQFVETLTQHSDIVLFGAAFPGQGGQNHINEAWCNYWAYTFADLGYKRYDLIRPQITGMLDIPPWYRFNTFFYANSIGAAQLKAAPCNQNDDLFKAFLTGQLGLKLSSRAFINSVQRAIVKRLQKTGHINRN